MAQLKVLFIGDPHFKPDNEIETDLMVAQVSELILTEKPDITFVAGDMDHTHEKVPMRPHMRSIKALQAWRRVSRKLVVNIGNHDRPHNNVFQTDEHSYNALKEWSDTLVIDRTYQCEEKTLPHLETGEVLTFNMVYVPYVPVGRFAAALASADLEPPYNNIAAIWAHQEFKGAKMGAITSSHGDPWPLEYPLCVSGHVHDYDRLQPNLIYGGTPIQHGYADTKDKTVSIFTFTQHDGKTQWEEKRHNLRIPKKIQITLTAEQLATYVLPPLTQVKIKVTGPAAVIREVMKLDHVVKLAATHGVKIVVVDTTPGLPLPSEGGIAPPKVKQTLRERIVGAVQLQDAELQRTFAHVFAT